LKLRNAALAALLIVKSSETMKREDLSCRGFHLSDKANMMRA
jgi:hypothetical protein